DPDRKARPVRQDERLTLADRGIIQTFGRQHRWDFLCRAEKRSAFRRFSRLIRTGGMRCAFPPYDFLLDKYHSRISRPFQCRTPAWRLTWSYTASRYLMRCGWPEM